MILHNDPVPLRESPAGIYRVGKSNVLLEIVVEAFENGDSPEIIAHHYPTLNLADVYGVIGYCLRHREEVAAYMAEYEAEAQRLEKLVKERQGPGLTREELLRRKVAMDEQRAAASDG